MEGEKTTWGSTSKFSASRSLHLRIKIDFTCNCWRISRKTMLKISLTGSTQGEQWLTLLYKSELTYSCVQSLTKIYRTYLKKNLKNLNSSTLSTATDVSITHLKAYILFLDFSHWQRQTTEDSCQHTWEGSNHKEALQQGISSYLQIVWRMKIPFLLLTEAHQHTRGRTKYFGCFPTFLQKTKNYRPPSCHHNSSDFNGNQTCCIY